MLSEFPDDGHLTTYEVRTLHRDGGPFITPVRIRATSARRAAVIRLEALSRAAREACSALLVCIPAGDALIFPTVTKTETTITTVLAD